MSIVQYRKKVDKPCSQCGEMMRGVYPQKDTCSQRCRSKKFNDRQRAAIQEQQT